MDSVLFISPQPADAKLLARLLGQDSPVRLEHVATLAEARKKLQRETFGVLLTEAYLTDGDWTKVLDLTYHLASCPAVIVTHRVADDRFWAEVLNLGAYDLLAQPFDATEVQRILAHACSQTSARRHEPARAQAGSVKPRPVAFSA